MWSRKPSSSPAVQVLITPLQWQSVDAIVSVHIEVLHSVLCIEEQPHGVDGGGGGGGDGVGGDGVGGGDGGGDGVGDGGGGMVVVGW